VKSGLKLRASLSESGFLRPQRPTVQNPECKVPASGFTLWLVHRSNKKSAENDRQLPGRLFRYRLAVRLAIHILSRMERVLCNEAGQARISLTSLVEAETSAGQYPMRQ